FDVPSPVGLLGTDPALRQQVADRARDRLEFGARRGGGDRGDLIKGQMPFVEGVAATGERDRTAIAAVERSAGDLHNTSNDAMASRRFRAHLVQTAAIARQVPATE